MKSETRQFLELLKELQKIDAEFPIQYAVCLAEISLNEGLSLTELSRKTGIALSTVSRIVGALSQHRQKGTPYGLVKMKTSSEERRKKELYLTARGQKSIQDITNILS